MKDRVSSYAFFYLSLSLFLKNGVSIESFVFRLFWCAILSYQSSSLFHSSPHPPPIHPFSHHRVHVYKLLVPATNSLSQSRSRRLYKEKSSSPPEWAVNLTRWRRRRRRRPFSRLTTHKSLSEKRQKSSWSSNVFSHVIFFLRSWLSDRTVLPLHFRRKNREQKKVDGIDTSEWNRSICRFNS